MQQLPDALAALAAYGQFSAYKLMPNKTRPGKMDKLPCDSTGKVRDAHDTTVWTSVQTAINWVQALGDGYGVAFTVTENDPFFFIDIDDCVINGAWSPLANELMTQFAGAAIEVSQSNTGLHIIGTGVPAVASEDRRKKAKGVNFDLYTQKRFIALTGTNITGDASSVHTDQLNILVERHLKKSISANNAGWTTEAHPDSRPIADDDELIARAVASKSVAGAFGTRANFSDLWSRNVDVLSIAYPPDRTDTGKEYDDSEADLALTQHLAFWTGSNCERMRKLMWRSALVRDKWENRDGYVEQTIEKSTSLQTSFYTKGGVDVAVEPLGELEGPTIVTGYQFLGVDQQIEHFKRCVYIQDIHRIFTPHGSLLKTEQFNATYGGYVFQLESDSNGKTTRKAWEAFTESQAVRYPKAEIMCFKPGHPQGVFKNQEGQSFVNTYVPINTPRKKGDVSPFLNHLKKVLPVEKDQQILIAYMAACVQHKGVKFQWAPILQGVEGNGKTLFTRCVAFAVGRRYTHFPKAADLDNKFNSWLVGKLFIGVEDIYVPEHKSEVIEAVKPMITGGDGLEIQYKGVDQITTDICANFIFNSNHRNAIRKTRNDRRFATFYSAQQSASDLTRDGMDGGYFPQLYKWLDADGYAIVSQYLDTYTIPDELNPATACHRAPDTSSTLEAIAEGLGGVEQEILEAINQGRPGFAGGWISSMALDRLLQALRAERAIPVNKRRTMLKELGYEWHPGLPQGRVNNHIAMDGGKPRLFIQNSHLSANLKSVAEIVKAYTLAQGSPTIMPKGGIVDVFQ